MRTTQTTQATTQVFNRALKATQKAAAAPNKEQLAFRTLYDLPLMGSIKRLQGIKRDFKNIAFAGPNPYLFLQHLPKTYEVDKFYFTETSEASVQRSLDLIQSKIDSGFYEKQGCILPNEIIPVVADDETWSKEFKERSLDLVVSNATMHWCNELETTFKQMHDSLESDGVFMASVIGGDTLQELRICLNLAELERDGGVSPIVSPMLSLTEMGNTFARCKFTMPTCDITHTVVEFTDCFQLMDFLQDTGE